MYQRWVSCVKLRSRAWDTALIYSVWDTVLIFSPHNLGTQDVSKVTSTVCVEFADRSWRERSTRQACNPSSCPTPPPSLFLQFIFPIFPGNCFELHTHINSHCTSSYKCRNTRYWITQVKYSPNIQSYPKLQKPSVSKIKVAVCLFYLKISQTSKTILKKKVSKKFQKSKEI